MMKLAILGSTRGTNLTAIAEAIEHGQLQAKIELVVSNKSDALILERARSHRLRAQFIDSAGLSRDEYDTRVTTSLRAYDVNVVVLVGYMRILSPSFVQEWAHKIINVHPSLLPAFGGLMDLAVHEAVLAAGVHETGCTVHYVTEEVDAGPIIIQKSCAIRQGDTAQQLKERVQQLEGTALVAALSHLTN